MTLFQRCGGLLGFIKHRLRHPGALLAAGRNYCFSGDMRLTNGGTIIMGRQNVLCHGFDIEAQGRLNIGSRNFFNRNVKIVCLEEIHIGDDCIIADSVHVYDHDHAFADYRRLIRQQGFRSRPVRIGSNVWIGAKATLLKGVHIGDGAVIGAHAVVNKDVPANAVAAGNPAKIIKMRTA